MDCLQIGILIMISMHVGAQVIAALDGAPIDNPTPGELTAAPQVNSPSLRYLI